MALWGNLGVSLLGPTAALFILAPTGTAMSLFAAFVAVLIGSLIGVLPVAAMAFAGAETGQPSMVLLRGLFGARLSFLPTLLNLIQCVGWGIFELVVIASAASELLPWDTRWCYVLAGGIVTTLMALRPLGVVRVLRRYVLVAVAVSMTYFLVQLARGTVAQPDGGRLDRLLAGRRRGDRGLDLLGAAGRRLHPSCPLATGAPSAAPWPATRSPRSPVTSSACSRIRQWCAPRGESALFHAFIRGSVRLAAVRRAGAAGARRVVHECVFDCRVCAKPAPTR